MRVCKIKRIRRCEGAPHLLPEGQGIKGQREWIMADKLGVN